NTASATCAYKVVYDFRGFLPPASAPLNAETAGQAIPVKWQIPDGLGGFVSSLASVSGIQLVQNPCPAPAATQSANKKGAQKGPAKTAKTAAVRYDTTDNQFIYNWKTEKGMAGTCYSLKLGLNDGTVHTAEFAFR
ncbi:MAG TPA: PxKF domain-containing protein, partial [Verrucomicrobiae bacterium]|nr:PxKF domain-containing protein [Verrucomicrobiae bacterium]